MPDLYEDMLIGEDDFLIIDEHRNRPPQESQRCEDCGYELVGGRLPCDECGGGY